VFRNENDLARLGRMDVTWRPFLACRSLAANGLIIASMDQPSQLMKI
jgi:hypothetical protein